MRDYFLSDAEAGKLAAGWSSFEVWKNTIHEPRVNKRAQDNRPLWQLLDEEEDRQRLRRRKIVRALGLSICLLVTASAAVLLRY